MARHSKWSDIKRQKGLTERRGAARQASRRMIARGERPLYRPRLEADAEFIFIRILELDIATEARRRSEVAAMTRDLARRSGGLVRHRVRGFLGQLASAGGQQPPALRRSSQLPGEVDQARI